MHKILFLVALIIRGLSRTTNPTPSGVPAVGLIRDGNGDTGMEPMIRRLEEERSAALEFIDWTCAGAESEKRDLSAF
jgi:hypothetical protein